MTVPSASPHRGWTLVAVGALMTCVAIGVVFSLAVFLDPMGKDTGWSRAGISTAMTLAFLSMGVGGFGWGALSDRFGPRLVVLAGTVLLGLSNVLASRATSLLEFQLLYGVMMGVAAGSYFAPLISATAASFDRHRSLAVSLVTAGVGVAPLTMSPLAAWLLTGYGWRTAQLVIGLGAWAVLLPAAWLVPARITAPGALPATPAARQSRRRSARRFARGPSSYWRRLSSPAAPRIRDRSSIR